MANPESYTEFLNKSDCEEIVAKLGGDIKVIDFNIKPASNNVVGFMGEYFNLNIKIEKSCNSRDEVNFFLKSLPISSESYRSVIESGGFMKKEIIMFNNLFKQMEKYPSTKWRPEFYLTRDNILVLEDLTKAGYVHFTVENDQKKGYFNFLPKPHIHAVLKCLAAMHANSIAYEVKSGESITKFKEYLKEKSLNGDSWFIVGLKAIMKLASMHPNYQNDAHQEFILNELEKRTQKVCEMCETSNKFQNVLCHRDTWGKNFFFKKIQNSADEELECLLVDFQLCRYQPPAVDVLMFLYLNTSYKERSTALLDYLKFYYANLEKETTKYGLNLENYLSKEEFKSSCKELQLLPLALTALYWPVFCLPEDFLTTIRRNDKERYYHFMAVDRTELILEQIEVNEFYKDCVFNAVGELVDYLYKN